MKSDAWWHTENQDVQNQSLTPHKDFASIFNFMISVLLIFVLQFGEQNQNLFVWKFFNKPSVVWFCAETVNFGQFILQ